MENKILTEREEKEFDEKFGDSDGWNPSSVGTKLENEIKHFIAIIKSKAVEEERERILKAIEEVEHDCDDPYVCGCMEVRDILLKTLKVKVK